MKAHHGAFKVAGAFQAAARPLYAGVVQRQPRLARVGTAIAGEAAKPTLAELSEGPYFVVAVLLDAETLCRTDATCRLLRKLNRASVGPWRALGTRLFHGLELEQEGSFEQIAEIDSESGDSSGGGGGGGRKQKKCVDWKWRFRQFRADVATFCPPFDGPEISAVRQPDEVAYFQCRLCADIVGEKASARGVYLEVEVLVNPDNLSMAVVDFEGGGCSSVTFSPDTGAVIRERKVQEAPRKVEGAYIQPLPTVPPGRRFQGRMGLYLCRGRLAFFRRCVEEEGASAASDREGGNLQLSSIAPGAPTPRGAGTGAPGNAARGSAGTPTTAASTEMGPWETTGFVSDLSWAEGRRLTPCLAFRDEGAYRVRVVCVGQFPPLLPEEWPGAPRRDLSASGGDDDPGWSGFDWEVGPPAVVEEAGV